MLYRNLSGYFRERYGKRLKKICIDGGFTCPNRDGKCGTGGCIYCGERGAGEHITPALSITEQVKVALEAAKPNDKFIAYFQNFSNTYAEPSVLKERYDAALTDERIVALAIGTRPDCLDEEKARLIAEYKKTRDVWVELGLQTSNEETAKLINRGYKHDVFENAITLLKKYSIPVVAHMIIGLPSESEEDAVKTAKYISSLGIWGVKIHSIYVMEGTRLAQMYRSGEYTPPERDYYVKMCSRSIARLSPEIIVHRITGDCPGGLLVAPSWNSDKNLLINLIRRELEENGMRQGDLYSK